MQISFRVEYETLFGSWCDECRFVAFIKSVKWMQHDNGIFAGIMMNPVLPFITDRKEDIRELVRLAHENGARFIHTYMGVTLRENQRDYYYEKLDELDSRYYDVIGEAEADTLFSFGKGLQASQAKNGVHVGAKEYSKGQSDLNIVVFDPRINAVIDSVNINLDTAALTR